MKINCYYAGKFYKIAASMTRNTLCATRGYYFYHSAIITCFESLWCDLVLIALPEHNRTCELWLGFLFDTTGQALFNYEANQKWDGVRRTDPVLLIRTDIPRGTKHWKPVALWTHKQETCCVCSKPATSLFGADINGYPKPATATTNKLSQPHTTLLSDSRAAVHRPWY